MRNACRWRGRGVCIEAWPTHTIYTVVGKRNNCPLRQESKTEEKKLMKNPR